MKKLTSILTIVVLSASIALAEDGHTGSGGRCDTCTPPPPCTENCGGFAGDDGGLTGPGSDGDTQNTEENSFINEWTEYFFELIG